MANAREVVIDIATGFGFFYFWGKRSGGASNPSTVTLPPGTDAADCAQACSDWDNARQMLCGAKSDDAAARSRADGIRGQLFAALAAEAALIAAAVTATVAATVAVLPWVVVVLIVVAAILWLAVLALMATAAFLGGELNSAESDVATKASARQAWDNAVAADRATVNRTCSQAEANACLSRTAPC